MGADLCPGNLLIWLKHLKDNFLKLAGCAFFGFFVLHFFETNAYQYEKVPVVVFSLLGSATITTFIVTAIINRKLLALNQIFSCIAAIGGFWFTVRALTMIGSESVQLFELSEPLISIGFAFIFLQQILNGIQLLGGISILCAIFINMRFSKSS